MSSYLTLAGLLRPPVTLQPDLVLYNGTQNLGTAQVECGYITITSYLAFVITSSLLHGFVCVWGGGGGGSLWETYWLVESLIPTGTLRNVSSAGEPARVFMRSSSGLVDCLLWIVKAAVQQTHEDGVDEKVNMFKLSFSMELLV